MCDYSLHYVASRPAKVGERLVSTNFAQTTTRGFASIHDRNVAVCLLPGTELAFEEEVRCDTGFVFTQRLGHKVAKFREVNLTKYTYIMTPWSFQMEGLSCDTPLQRATRYGATIAGRRLTRHCEPRATPNFAGRLG